MERKTLKIDERTFRRLQDKAAAEGTTPDELANRLLRQALTSLERTPYVLALRGWSADLRPGADILDRNALFNAMSPFHPAA